jgi:hypothetical protein
MTEKRRPDEQPAAVAKLGWRYHHLGIPHAVPRSDEQHLDDLGVHVCGFETSPYGIEWIRFEAHCEVPQIVKTVPHVAFAVDDLDEALNGKDILIAPNAPSAGVRVAFILDNGAPVELLQFDHDQRPKTNHACRTTRCTRRPPDLHAERPRVSVDVSHAGSCSISVETQQTI